MNTRTSRHVRLAVGSLAATSLVAAAGVLTILPAQAAVTPGSASTIAQAIEGQPGLVTGASFVTKPGKDNAGTMTNKLGGLPVQGSSYGVLSTGHLAELLQTESLASGSLMGEPVRGDTDLDVTILKVDVDVPEGKNCLSFDFKFGTEEYDTYVGEKWNDAFIAELDKSTWKTSDAAISAPNNFAFDAAGHVVSVNSTGLGGLSASAGAGTAFNKEGADVNGGATKLLSASTDVTPGSHSVYFSIFDQGDRIYDSAVFLDNLRAGQVESGKCKAGAVIWTPEPTPTKTATPEPTKTATPEPTKTATPEPTKTATPEPTKTATPEPTKTVEPTVEPTKTVEPTVEPTKTVEPTSEPTKTAEPTKPAEPTVKPSKPAEPTAKPTPGRGLDANTGDETDAIAGAAILGALGTALISAAAVRRRK